MTYENTTLSSFKDLGVTYQVLLIQEGLKLSGSGEKVSEGGTTQARVVERTSISSAVSYAITFRVMWWYFITRRRMRIVARVRLFTDSCNAVGKPWMAVSQALSPTVWVRSGGNAGTVRIRYSTRRSGRRPAVPD